jgi:ubiquitin-like 1-activating enzyme E1 B
VSSELFGTSEDASELDETEDVDNGTYPFRNAWTLSNANQSSPAAEIANLRKEAQALKAIRNSMGSDDFAEKIFTKVFIDDIVRLRDMDDVWKSRKAPEPLSFGTLNEEAKSVPEDIPQEDQKVWSLSEDLAVFKDSLDRLTKRYRTMQAEAGDGSLPIISFDKDDPDTLDFVASSANLRSAVYGIEEKSKFDIKREFFVAVWMCSQLTLTYLQKWRAISFLLLPQPMP